MRKEWEKGKPLKEQVKCRAWREIKDWACTPTVGEGKGE